MNFKTIIASLIASVGVITGAYDSTKALVEGFRAQIAMLTGKLGDAMQSLNVVSSKLVAANQQIDDLQAQVSSSNTALAEAKAQLETYEGLDLTSLQSAADQVAGVAASAKALSDHLAGTSEDHSKATDAVATVTADTVSLTGELEEQSSKIAEAVTAIPAPADAPATAEVPQ